MAPPSASSPSAPATSVNPVPTGPRDLAVFARQNWVLAFDHISAFSPQLSAALCRLSSNAGLPLRERGVLLNSSPELPNIH